MSAEVDEFLARVIAEVAERGLGESGKAVVP